MRRLALRAGAEMQRRAGMGGSKSQGAEGELRAGTGVRLVPLSFRAPLKAGATWVLGGRPWKGQTCLKDAKPC